MHVYIRHAVVQLAPQRGHTYIATTVTYVIVIDLLVCDTTHTPRITPEVSAVSVSYH